MTRTEKRKENKHFNKLLDILMKYKSERAQIDKTRHGSNRFRNYLNKARKLKELYSKSEKEWVSYANKTGQNPELFAGYLRKGF